MARRQGPQLRNLIYDKAQAADHVMRSEAADSHQGQERDRSSNRPDRLTHPAPPSPTGSSCGGRRSLIASPLSTGFCCFCCRAGVTVLSAVGKIRRNIWFEAGAAMSTAGSRGVLRGPRPSVAVACTLAPSGNHPIRGNAWMDPGEGIVRRPPAARTSGMAPPTATCYAESRRVFGPALCAPCRRLIVWQSPGPSPSDHEPV
jgi:hypothetical protein